MKRLKIATGFIALSLIVVAQTEFDALKFIQPDINGTARYSAMAGAFGALGADPSAIKDNPAGLGIYRSSEFSGTFNVLSQSTQTEWMRKDANDGLFKGGFNQFSFVHSGLPGSSISRSTGLKRSNWSFTYNRLKDFNRQLRINGGSGVSGSALDYIAYFTADIPGADLYKTNSYDPYNNTSVPWISAAAANADLIKEFVWDDNGKTAYWAPLLDDNEKVSPSYYQRESGHFDEYSLSWSGNFNNRFFLGASFNIYNLKYVVNSEYKEDFSVVGSMTMNNYLSSSATGLGVRLGAIYIPFDFLRLGASLRAPMVYSVNDINYLDLHYNHGGSNFGTIYTPEGSNSFKLQSPMVYNLSTALILGKKGVIGLEYMNSDNSTSKYMNKSGNSFSYRYENDTIAAVFNQQHTLKIGGEYKLTENVALRAGYAMSTAPTDKRLSKEMNPNTNRTDIEYFVPGTTSYLTGGVGYRNEGWAFDLALINRIYNEDFYSYNPKKVDKNLRVPSAAVTTTNLSVLATISVRF